MRASETVKRSELRAQFLKMVQDRGKPYGIVIRKMDFPTTAPGDRTSPDVHGSLSGRRRTARQYTAPGVSRLPGREGGTRAWAPFARLVRSNLKDIVAVFDESYVFNYLNTLGADVDSENRVRSA